MSGFAPRHLALPRDQTLVVREIEPADRAGLEALYAALSRDDRYLRFFSAYRPDERFFTRKVDPDARPGCGLVAVIGQKGADPRRIVGEAAYALLPNGDGELAMTVAEDWRGWLGPYLLDALLLEAQRRGVPNLEADVLMTNRRMMSLLQARGYAIMDSPDWTIVRLIVGTAGETPSWPDGRDRLRVLVEGPASRWHAAGVARDCGIDVLACPALRGARRGCPALAGRSCVLASAADVIVISHPDERDRWDDLVRAHRHLHSGVPLRVETPGSGEAVDLLGPVLPEGDDQAEVEQVREAALRHRAGRARSGT